MVQTRICVPAILNSLIFLSFTYCSQKSFIIDLYQISKHHERRVPCLRHSHLENMYLCHFCMIFWSPIWRNFSFLPSLKDSMIWLSNVETIIIGLKSFCSPESSFHVVLSESRASWISKNFLEGSNTPTGGLERLRSPALNFLATLENHRPTQNSLFAALLGIYYSQFWKTA